MFELTPWAVVGEPTPEQNFQLASIRDLEQEFLTLLDTLPMSRDIALAKTKMEEAAMWAAKGITNPPASASGER